MDYKINNHYSIRASSHGLTVISANEKCSLSRLSKADAVAIMKELKLSDRDLPKEQIISEIRKYFTTNSARAQYLVLPSTQATGCVSGAVPANNVSDTPFPHNRTCKCPGCNQVLREKDREYCSRYHNHLQFLSEQSRSVNNLNRSTLAQIFLYEQIKKYQDKQMKVKVNNLQPEITPYFAQFSYGYFNSTHQILDIYVPNLDIFKSILGRKVDGTDNIKVQDQIARGDFFVDQLFNSEIHKIIRILDGHGFLLLYILSKIRDKFGDDVVDQLKIEFVDLNPMVTAWHKKMFNCPSWKFLQEDIIMNNIPYSQPEADSRLVYFNFCGIKDSYEKIIHYFRESKHFRTCLLSFSNARGAAIKDYENSLKGYSAHQSGKFLNQWKIMKVHSPRKSFSTYTIIKTN